MKIKELHEYTANQADQILLLNYDDQVAKDSKLSSICSTQRDYDKLCKAYRVVLALMLQHLYDAGRYYASLPVDELEEISEIFHIACNAKLCYQTDVMHIDADKLLRMYADRKLGWDKDIKIVEQLKAEYCYNMASAKSNNCNSTFDENLANSIVFLKFPIEIEHGEKLKALLQVCPCVCLPLYARGFLRQEIYESVYSYCRDASRKGILDEYSSELLRYIRVNELVSVDILNRDYQDFSKRMAARNLGITLAEVDAKYISIFGFNREKTLACLASRADISNALIDKIDGYPIERTVGNFSFKMYSQNMDITCDGIIDMFQNNMLNRACRRFYTRCGLDKIQDILNDTAILSDSDAKLLIENIYQQATQKLKMRKNMLL